MVAGLARSNDFPLSSTTSDFSEYAHFSTVVDTTASPCGASARPSGSWRFPGTTSPATSARRSADHAPGHRDHGLHDLGTFGRSEGNGPRVVSRDLPRLRVVRLRLRGFRDDLRDPRHRAPHQPRAPLRRRDPGEGASFLDWFLVSGRRRELRGRVQPCPGRRQRHPRPRAQGYARRGTGFDTRLTVLERSSQPEIRIHREARASDAAELLDAVIAQVPRRSPVAAPSPPAGPARDLFGKTVAPKPAKRRGPKYTSTPETRQAHDWGPVSELAVETGAVEPASTDADASASAGPYASWRPGVVRVPGAVEHPTPLVQSAAMAAVPHPVPSYRPMLSCRRTTAASSRAATRRRRSASRWRSRRSRRKTSSSGTGSR